MNIMYNQLFLLSKVCDIIEVVLDPVLQIRWGKKDNLRIILHVSPLKCIL